MLQRRFAFLGEYFSKKPFIVACTAAMVAFLLAHNFIKQREKEVLQVTEAVSVVSAVRDIAAGEAIDESSIKLVSVPRRFVQPSALSSVNETGGRVAVIPVKAGSHITTANAKRPSEARGVSYLIPSGRRAVALAVNDALITAGLIKPNDMVDVIATFDLGSDASVRRTTFTIIEGVQVLATGAEVADTLPEAPAKARKTGLFGGGAISSALNSQTSVTLAVTPLEAQALFFALESGVLNISLRPFGEEAMRERPPPTTISTLGGGNDLVPMKRGYREYRGR